ncbi:MAG: phospho-sugar mutase, partial [Christensenellaceae bacterium]|nr:phospho-sugar mutase [Christensenellaceae bacterium]
MMSELDIWKKNVTAEELRQLNALDKATLADSFARPLAFGTAGMRGVIGLGIFRMNDYTVARATKGLSLFVKAQGQEKRGVVIAYDTRRFSKQFAQIAAEVLSAYGIKVYLYDGVRPVPVCSYRIREKNAFAGIMITASHNPKEYNGYKVYGEDGAQMSPENTDKVVAYIEKSSYFNTPLSQENIVTISDDSDYYDKVISQSVSEAVVKKFGKDVKLVYSPLHGAGRVPVLEVFKKLGINALVVKEQEMPDTEFSTIKVPNPEFRDTLSMGIALAQKNDAELVIATDPDCDRIGVAVRNAQGEYIILTGNQIGALLLDYILERLNEDGKLPKNGAVVKSIVTTTLADRIAESYGIKCFNVLTGFKF